MLDLLSVSQVSWPAIWDTPRWYSEVIPTSQVQHAVDADLLLRSTSYTIRATRVKKDTDAVDQPELSSRLPPSMY
jgi:hypothetical protein